ncbi:hypothetical protein N9Q47_05495, partial [Vicingaceae bacterium]|nr:hypothetical protein [Vicingaceae bacterium]
MKLVDKTIFILSPQDWEHIKVSKHHYAMALAYRGNDVYFVNPPQKGLKYLLIKKIKVQKNLTIVNHSLWFPYNLKFHFTSLFKFLLRIHIFRLKSLKSKIDLIWSFTALYPELNKFNSSKVIYHQVDNIMGPGYTEPAFTSNIVLGVAESILDRFNHNKKFLIEHGLSQWFIKEEYYSWEKKNETINVCYCGNLALLSIDREIIKEIVSSYTAINFHFIGPFSDTDESFVRFKEMLEKAKNVKLYGKIEPKEIAELYVNMDAFLICYDRQSTFAQSRNKSSNSHKILEYLS